LFILNSCWIGDRLLDAVSAGGGFKLGEHALEPGLEAAFFGRSELVGNDKAGEAYQCLLDVLKASLQHGSCGRNCRAGCGLRPQHSQGRTQKLAPVRLVGHAVGRDQRQSLGELQAVTLHGAQHGLLIPAGQGAQGVGQGGTDLPLSKLLLSPDREPRSDIHPTSHPLGFAPKPAGDTCGA
jgi:hypothetical protein